MAYTNDKYDNNNRGVLFRNEKKTEDKHPDWRGNININGTEFWISGWKKFTQKGEIVSLSVQPKEKTEPKPAPKQQDNFEDEVPW